MHGEVRYFLHLLVPLWISFLIYQKIFDRNSASLFFGIIVCDIGN